MSLEIAVIYATRKPWAPPRKQIARWVRAALGRRRGAWSLGVRVVGRDEHRALRSRGLRQGCGVDLDHLPAHREHIAVRDARARHERRPRARAHHDRVRVDARTVYHHHASDASARDVVDEDVRDRHAARDLDTPGAREGVHAADVEARIEAGRAAG